MRCAQFSPIRARSVSAKCEAHGHSANRRQRHTPRVIGRPRGTFAAHACSQRAPQGCPAIPIQPLFEPKTHVNSPCTRPAQPAFAAERANLCDVVRKRM